MNIEYRVDKYDDYDKSDCDEHNDDAHGIIIILITTICIAVAFIDNQLHYH